MLASCKLALACSPCHHHLQKLAHPKALLAATTFGHVRPACMHAWPCMHGLWRWRSLTRYRASQIGGPRSIPPKTKGHFPCGLSRFRPSPATPTTNTIPLSAPCAPSPAGSMHDWHACLRIRIKTRLCLLLYHLQPHSAERLDQATSEHARADKQRASSRKHGGPRGGSDLLPLHALHALAAHDCHEGVRDHVWLNTLALHRLQQLQRLVVLPRALARREQRVVHVHGGGRAVAAHAPPHLERRLPAAGQRVRGDQATVCVVARPEPARRHEPEHRLGLLRQARHAIRRHHGLMGHPVTAGHEGEQLLRNVELARLAGRRDGGVVHDGVGRDAQRARAVDHVDRLGPLARALVREHQRPAHHLVHQRRVRAAAAAAGMVRAADGCQPWGGHRLVAEQGEGGRVRTQEAGRRWRSRRRGRRLLLLHVQVQVQPVKLCRAGPG
mmetsp:Transcript_2119/g.5365  ORF Transcript_2119/g.5365 Transcript_2119/m.5365 type:complete len:441 (+) Transcript_2119:1313-2635(+)